MNLFITTFKQVTCQNKIYIYITNSQLSLGANNEDKLYMFTLKHSHTSECSNTLRGHSASGVSESFAKRSISEVIQLASFAQNISTIINDMLIAIQ